MEESLEQERLKLDEVLKMEIKALNRVFSTLIPPRSLPFPCPSPFIFLNLHSRQVRAYARDMEESLEQERLKLEEVLKMEIKARITTGEALRDSVNGTLAEVRKEMSTLDTRVEGVVGKLREHVDKVSTSCLYVRGSVYR